MTNDIDGNFLSRALHQSLYFQESSPASGCCPTSTYLCLASCLLSQLLVLEHEMVEVLMRTGEVLIYLLPYITTNDVVLGGPLDKG